MNIEQVKNAITQIQNQFNKLNIGGAMGAKTSGIFGELEKEIEKFQSLSSKKIGTEKSFKPLEDSGRRIIQLYSQLENSIKNISGLSKKQMENLFPSSVKNNIEKATNALSEYEKKTKQSSQEIKKLEAEGKRLKNTLDTLNNKKSALQGRNVKDDASATQKAAAALKEYQAAQEQVAQKQQEIEKAQKGHKAVTPLREEKAQLEAVANDLKAKYENLAAAKDKIFTQTKKDEALSQLANQIREAEGNLNKLNASLSNLKTNDQQAFSNLIVSLNQIKGINLDPTTATIDQVKVAISGLTESEFSRLFNGLKNVEGNFNSAQGSIQQFEGQINTAREKVSQMDDRLNQVNMLKNRVAYFFGLTNQIMLFRRAITQAMTAVKELDAAMTEIAVVTDFSIGDMWEKLPEYTRRANELGVAVKDLYAATGLYYQQGLKGNEVMELGVETMKMARIAGMDAADATKAMTAAIRGFNLEINEMSGKRVNDVYSQLAAMTASDTEGIATAMSKTASIAYSANMELETTAALLAQIIETTQESPETAGTAMKTIIARFTEVKQLFDEGMLTGKDEEGEEININRIDAALKTVGISLKDFLNGSKGIDDIFLELAQKWNTLDIATQRYIATTAAGSRQQSRFIAMMQDYDRTMELVTAANNSAGASQNQYEKTLESMETLLTKLKNAWQEFLTGIANNEVLKFGVKMLTGILNIVNKLTGSLPGLIGSFAKLGLAWGALKVGGSLLNKGLGTLVSNIATSGNNKKTVQTATLISTKNGVEQGTEAGVVKGLKDIGPWIKTKWAQFVGEGVALGAKKTPIQSLNRTRQQILKDKTIIATNKRMANSGLTLGTPEYEAERKRIQLEEFKRIKKEQQAADIKLKSAFIDKANADQNTLSSNMELESAYKEALGDKVELTAAQTEESTIVVEVNADIMENEAARRELMASLSERSGGKNIRLVGNKNLASTETRILSNTGGTTGGAVKENIWNKLGVGKGGGKWNFGNMAGGAIAGAIAGGIAGNWIGGQFASNNSSLEEQAGDLKVSLEGINSTISSITENLDGLDDAKKNFAELNKTLKETSKGSSEYTQALIKNNQAFFELNDDFNFLSNEGYYEKDVTTGAYTITDLGWQAYERDQTRKLEEANFLRLQSQAVQSQVDMAQAGIDFADSIGKGTSEITAKEEENIKTTATITGAATGGIAGGIAAGIAAGAAAGSLGGPIGIAIGAAAGLVFGALGALIGGGVAQGIYGSGLSADTYNEVALRAGKAGLADATQYSGADYNAFLQDVSGDLGIAVEDLKTIIETDKDAFAEHVAAMTKANAQILAIAEQTAIAQAEQMGLTGDAKQAYVETYKATVGEDDLSEEIAARYEERIIKEDKAREQYNWNEISGIDEHEKIAREYANIMGYTINEKDNENWLLDAAGQTIQEIPTLATMVWEITKKQVYDEKRQDVSELGLNVAEAQALGLKRGTANIDSFTLGSLQDTFEALNNIDVAKIDWIEDLEDIEAIQNIWGENDKGLKNKVNEILSGNIEEMFANSTSTYIDATTAAILNKTDYKLDKNTGIGKDMQGYLEQLYPDSEVDVGAYDLQELFIQLSDTNVSREKMAEWIEEIIEADIVGQNDAKEYLQEEMQLYTDLQAITAPFKEYIGEALENLTVNEAEALKGQFDVIGGAMTDQVTSLMADAAKALQESDLMDFEEILSLGLDPQAIYDYVSSMEEQNRITKEGADTLREYANSLADLNLGFDTISLTTLSEQIAGVQKYQNKISELELGEKLIVSQEEVDEMIKLGLADADDFWKTSEGFEYLGGSLDELNNTAEKILERLGGRIESTAEGQQRRKEIWNNTPVGENFRNSYNEETGDYEWISWTANEQDSEMIRRRWAAQAGDDLKSYYDTMTPHLSTDEQEKLGIEDWNNLTEADYNKLAKAAFDAGDFAIAAAIEQIKNQAVDEEGAFKFSQTSNYQSYSKGISAETLASEDASRWSQEEMEYFFNEFKDTGLFTEAEIAQAKKEGINSIAGVIAKEAKLLVESGTYDPQSANWKKQSVVRSASNEQLLGYIQSGEYINPDTNENYAQTELNRRFEELYGFDENSEEFQRMFWKAYGQSMEDAGDNVKYLSNMLKTHKLAASDSRKAAEKLGKAIADNSDEFKGATSRLKDQEVTLEQLTEGQREAYDVIKAYAEDAFGMEFDKDFIVNNADLFLQLAEGGDVAEKAFYKIGAAAAEARLKAEGVADAGNVVQTAIKQLDGLTFGIDGTADFSQIFDTLFALLKDANKVKEVLESMGYEIEIEPTRTKLVPISNHFLNEALTKQGWLWTGFSGEYNQWIKPGRIIGTKTGDSTGSTPGGGGGGGGGSSSEWENPYDESYNTLRAINAELRERDRLEREYQNLLDKEGTSWKELLSKSQDFIQNRYDENELQEKLADQRWQQIQALVTENEQYDKYVKIDEKNRDFSIVWKEIEGLEGENLSEQDLALRQGLEDYISALEDKFDSLYDAEEAAAEALDDIRDYVADLQDEYLNAETMIKDAIVSSYQEQIDKLSEINDSINDANSKLLDAVQSSIDQMRQDRENEKTEQELSDKERRLAYLRQDTSGANALEILELEKELEEGRQDYTDSLVDQKISQLQDQNDYAAEQRQQQIDIMTSQLEWFQESGEIFNLVSNLMEGMYGEDGKINWNSAGAQLLEGQAEAMSNMGKMKWMEDTENALTQAAVYLHLIADELIEGPLWGEMARDALAQANSSVSYNPNADYSSIMEGLVPGTEAYEQAEALRNFKITSQGLDYDKTGQEQHEASFNENFSEFLSGYNENNPESQINNLADFIDNFLVAKHGWPAFDPNVDYMSRILSAANSGNSTSAGIWELYRNRKIDEDPNIDSAEKTYAFWRAIPWDWYLKNINNPFDYIGPAFKTGGLADFTGPAWLDGTRSRPEMVLNQRDTQNFIQLKDILSGLLGHGSFNSSETNGDVYYNIDINVERISSDYDIDEVVNKIKQTIYEDASYRNVNAIHLIR